MATLIDAPEFTANEVYEILATDKVEGAAAGASFGGIGLSNQPHQQLANRTAFLKQRQDVNISNIAGLLAFEALFKGSAQPSGYLEIPYMDVNYGLRTMIIEWGNVNFGQPGDGEGLYGPYNFPIPFPNACLAFVPISMTPENPNKISNGDAVIMVSNSFLPTSEQFWIWVNQIGNAGPNSGGFYWIAIGF